MFNPAPIHVPHEQPAPVTQFLNEINGVSAQYGRKLATPRDQLAAFKALEGWVRRNIQAIEAGMPGDVVADPASA